MRPGISLSRMSTPVRCFRILTRVSSGHSLKRKPLIKIINHFNHHTMENKEQHIYLPRVEAGALLWQAISLGTRMELLDLLDYAKENGIDSVPVRHIQEEVIGLRKLDEKEYYVREKRYLEAHENDPWGCKHEYIEPILEDGVYLVEDGFTPVRFNGAKSVPSPKLCNVMVSYHGHKWIVAKEDFDKLPLFSDDSHPEDTSSFYKCEIEALNDFDMKSCTGHLRKAGIAFELDADLYIPTAGQLAAMYLFRAELNKALELVGGTPMKEGVYWSSSEFDAWGSWGVNFDSGYVNYWNGEYGGNYVRPCLDV